MLKVFDIINHFAPRNAELETVSVTFNTNLKNGLTQHVNFTYNVKEQAYVDEWVKKNNIEPTYSEPFWSVNDFGEKHNYIKLSYTISNKIGEAETK
jgi:hypothetical protein